MIYSHQWCAIYLLTDPTHKVDRFHHSPSGTLALNLASQNICYYEMIHNQATFKCAVRVWCGCGISMPITAALYMSTKETNVRADVKKITALLDRLKDAKKLDYKIIDTSRMTGSERDKAYSTAILPSVFNKYEIRRIFGTNRKSGIFFGREQPALLVTGDMSEVFPHRKNGRTMTIERFLERLAEGLGVE